MSLKTVGIGIFITQLSRQGEVVTSYVHTVYDLFKSDFETTYYCKMIMPLRHRAASAKFRCGVAPLRIETGSFENKSLEERKCSFCDNVESGQHVLLDCCMYDDLRADLFCRALNIVSCFNSFS